MQLHRKPLLHGLREVFVIHLHDGLRNLHILGRIFVPGSRILAVAVFLCKLCAGGTELVHHFKGPGRHCLQQFISLLIPHKRLIVIHAVMIDSCHPESFSSRQNMVGAIVIQDGFVDFYGIGQRFFKISLNPQKGNDLLESGTQPRGGVRKGFINSKHMGLQNPVLLIGAIPCTAPYIISMHILLEATQQTAAVDTCGRHDPLDCLGDQWMNMEKEAGFCLLRFCGRSHCLHYKNIDQKVIPKRPERLFRCAGYPEKQILFHPLRCKNGQIQQGFPFCFFQPERGNQGSNVRSVVRMPGQFPMGSLDRCHFDA